MGARSGARGRTIELEPDLDWGRVARESEDAIRRGIDVVYQGALVANGWRGVADSLG